MFFIIWERFVYFIKDFALYLILLPIFLPLFALIVFKIYKSKISQVQKKAYMAFAASVFLIILVYTCFEAYFRYSYDVPDGLGYLKVNERWHDRHVVFNTYFFRDRDFEFEKKPETVRIGVLGDSIAFGGGIENVEDRFSNILEKKLAKSGKNVEVYNLGKPGYDTDGEIRIYQDVKQLKFDILVWEYFLNDIQPEGESTGTPIIENNSKKGRVVNFLSDKSVFFDFMYWRFSQRYQKTFQELRTADIKQYSNQEVLDKHKKDIADFTKQLKEENTKTFVIIFPSTFLLGPDYPAGDIHKMMGDFFRQNGAEVIDLLPDLIDKDPNQLMASKFDPHPNESVHQLAAEKLFGEINSYLSKK